MSKKKYLQTPMPTELHQRLKACAALAGIPMGHLICFLVEELTKGAIDKEDSLISTDEVLAKAKYYSPEPKPEPKPKSTRTTTTKRATSKKKGGGPKSS